jgi:hypothetical protein
MAHAKAPITTFDTDWAKIRSWATQEKLPTTAVNNVFALDNSRLQAGYYGMSNSERTRAIMAAAGLNYNTAIPTDKPGPSDVVGNTIRNAQGIFTGLMPNRLISNIWGTIKTTVKDLEHPGQAGGLGKVLSDTVASWIPGAYDVGQVIEAGGLVKGLEKLAEQPLTSILDVMPMLKYGDMGAGAVASNTAVGAALAKDLGITPSALGKMGAIRMAGKKVGRVQVGQKLRADLPPDPSLPAIRVPTIADRMGWQAMKAGVGRKLGLAAHKLADVNATQTYRMRDIRKNLKTKVASLTPNEVDANGAVLKQGEHGQFLDAMKSGRNSYDLLHDPQLAPAVKEAIEAYQPWLEWHQRTMVQAGKLLPFDIRETNPETGLTETHTAYYTANEFNELQGFRDEANKAAEEAAVASQEADAIAGQVDQIDAAYEPLRADFARVQTDLTNSMGVTGAFVRKSFTDLLGGIIGTDGLLHQMDAAFRANDWKLYRSLASKGVKKLESPKFAGETSQSIATLRNLMQAAQAHARAKASLESQYKRAWEGKAAKANQRAAETQAAFLKAVDKHPEAAYFDVFKKAYWTNLLSSDKAEGLLDVGAQKLVKEKGFSQLEADQLRRSNPQRLFEIIAIGGDDMFRDPFIPNMTPQDHRHFINDALSEVSSLRARGYRPMWVPTARDVDRPLIADDKIFVRPLHTPTIGSALRRAWDFGTTTNDVMLGVDRATAEILTRDGSIAFTMDQVKPMLKSHTDLANAVLHDENALRRLRGEPQISPKDIAAGHIKNHWGMVPYSVSELFDHTGLSPEELGLDPRETYYLPAAFKRQLGKLVGDQFPVHGTWDVATQVFKNSILRFSPRYTAHVLFGGGMLLTLAINPLSFRFVGDAAKLVRSYHRGELTDENMARIFQGSTQYGTPQQEMHRAAGEALSRWNIQEMMANHPWMSKARALAEVNYKFTNYISDVQRSIAYFDGIDKVKRGKRTFEDPVTGEVRPMTEEELHHQGMIAAEKVMGNLQAMTPLERSIARKIMPFYGWQKHILKYVLTYPVDHPWRVMFLSTLATQNSDNFASGLDERLQLLLFLGQPDVSGNVSAVDVRAMNPFRDVANYMTFQGWFSALNPVLTAPLEAIDPQLIYGSNVLHPNISYSQLYGTNVAGAQGGPLTMLQQFIPEFGALDSAFGLSAQSRAVAKQGGTAQLKNTLSSLGFPWTIQKLNLQQISAKHEIDRYNQAKTAALNAWQTGDFTELRRYPGTVPDPLQTGYEIRPDQLEKQYQAALKAHPGLAPSETVASLPAPRL